MFFSVAGSVKKLTSRTPKGVPDCFEISHSGQTALVRVKRMKGTQRYTLRVNAAVREAVLTMPSRGTKAAALEFATKHAAWICARLKRLPLAVPFVPGSVLPLRGLPHILSHRPESRGRAWTEASEEQTTPILSICVAGDLPHFRRRVADYLKREAELDLSAAVQKYCDMIGVSGRKITLRDTRSRWGSCSHDGRLNFSWRLILSPDYVLDYLAAHEVAHLIHMDHSEKFWELTHQLCPNTDRAETWLKFHGSDLYRYGETSAETKFE